MENVIVITLGDLDRARHAAAQLERLHAEDRIRLTGAGLVEHSPNGTVTVHQLSDDRGFRVTEVGTAAGAVLGLLVGPLGIVPGAATGAIIGSLADAAETEDSTRLLHALSAAVPRGKSAVIAAVAEPMPSPVDEMANILGAPVLRRERGEVELEIVAAEEAVLAAKRQVGRQSIGERLRAVKNALMTRD